MTWQARAAQPCAIKRSLKGPKPEPLASPQPNRVMSKALIIAEKPSVANDIARALGGFTKHDEYYESDDYVLSSAVGHLLEIAAPEEYDVKRGKWSFANLPVIPPHFDLNPIAKSESRLKVLTKLLKRKDIDRLINACDAGREGELIFRLIAQHAKAKQPVQRLWLQSMTAGCDPRRLRASAQRRRHAAARRCRPLPLGSGLARRHQRHARDDRVQQQGRRLLPDDRRARSDANVVDRRRTRGEDPPLRAARLLGSARGVHRREGPVRRPLVRPEIQARRERSRTARFAAVEPAGGRIDRRGLPRQDRHRHRRIEAVDANVAAALRPDEPAARSQRPLRLFGEEHARPRAGAV